MGFKHFQTSGSNGSTDVAYDSNGEQENLVFSPYFPKYFWDPTLRTTVTD